MTHHYSVTIKEHHLDTFGHVNNAQYLSLFEEARWEIITQRGYGLDKIRSTGLGPTILGIEIKYLKELKLRQEVIIETQFHHYDRKIGMFSQKMLIEATVCCTAEFKYGLFDLKARKLVLPTEEWLLATCG